MIGKTKSQEIKLLKLKDNKANNKSFKILKIDLMKLW